MHEVASKIKVIKLQTARASAMMQCPTTSKTFSGGKIRHFSEIFDVHYLRGQLGMLMRIKVAIIRQLNSVTIAVIP